MYWTFYDVENDMILTINSARSCRSCCEDRCSVSLQSNNDQLFVFSFPCGEAYMAWSSDLRHQHNQVWTFRKIFNRFGISFRFSKSLSESQKTLGECPNMENVTRHVVLNFRVFIHAWRGSTVKHLTRVLDDVNKFYYWVLFTIDLLEHF